MEHWPGFVWSATNSSMSVSCPLPMAHDAAICRFPGWEFDEQVVAGPPSRRTGSSSNRGDTSRPKPGEEAVCLYPRDTVCGKGRISADKDNGTAKAMHKCTLSKANYGTIVRTFSPLHCNESRQVWAGYALCGYHPVLEQRQEVLTVDDVGPGVGCVSCRKSPPIRLGPHAAQARLRREQHRSAGVASAEVSRTTGSRIHQISHGMSRCGLC